jgi:hypothetical protein
MMQTTKPTKKNLHQANHILSDLEPLTKEAGLILDSCLTILSQADISMVCGRKVGAFDRREWNSTVSEKYVGNWRLWVCCWTTPRVLASQPQVPLCPAVLYQQHEARWHLHTTRPILQSTIDYWCSFRKGNEPVSTRYLWHGQPTVFWRCTSFSLTCFALHCLTSVLLVSDWYM